PASRTGDSQHCDKSPRGPRWLQGPNQSRVLAGVGSYDRPGVLRSPQGVHQVRPRSDRRGAGLGLLRSARIAHDVPGPRSSAAARPREECRLRARNRNVGAPASGGSMAELNVGIIGAGGIAQKLHLPQLAEMPEVEVVSLSGRKEHRLRSLAERFNVPRWTTD